ncbi:hypothetical protein ACSV4D_16295 [Flavobacterium sp. ARAG 55.4]|uniref:hypothetical protein n=1 Tax=Flavobacterium sp. ARAG 55.4 TaxID=3451357 RepID=UPI003F47C5B1
MIKTIEILLLIIFPITIISFVVFFFIGASIKIQMWAEDSFEELKNFKLGIPSFTTTIIGFVLIFSLTSLENNLARNEIKDFITHNKDLQISANNIIIDSLRKPFINITKRSYQRNTGNVEIKVLVKSKSQELPIRLLRASDDETKYWVFLEKYQSTSKNCIGEINTILLDRF